MKPLKEDPKEMVGGCCVCSDENGWTENPLVYCDGQGCNVAVHQACYGIVTVPTGSWFCRKCESQERAARVRCELCPSRNGALKRTDSGGWAHVVCALYIPEVRFGNVTSMEPIMLQLIPQERFTKVCYICEEGGRTDRAPMGACMQCNKLGCKQNFHVTCAQAKGLLCEEAGNYQDNVKYCGYCSHHYSRLRKGSHVKTIPPYRPLPHAETPDSDDDHGADVALKQRVLGRPLGEFKFTGKSDLTVGASVGSHETNSLAVKEEEKFPLAGVSGLTAIGGKEGGFEHRGTPPSGSRELSAVTNHIGTTVITTSMTPTISLPTVSISKLVLPSSFTTSTTPVTTSVTTVSSFVQRTLSLVISTSGGVTSVSHPPSVLPLVTASNTSVVTSVSHGRPTPMVSEAAKLPSVSGNGLVVRPGVVLSSGSAVPMDTEEQISPVAGVLNIFQEKNLSVERSEIKIKGTPPPIVHVASASRVAAPVPVSISKGPMARSRGPPPSINLDRSLHMQLSSNVSSQRLEEVFASLPPSNFETTKKGSRGQTSERGVRKPRGGNVGSKRGRLRRGTVLGAGESSPDSVGESTASAPKKGRRRGPEKDSLNILSNGIGVNSLLLGNQLNPNSADAQSMSDTLKAELEAHSIYKDEDKFSSLLVGPMLPGKKEASNALGGNQPPPFPQSLEQLLERQWEQGSQFLMEQSQHFDIASLLSCLHQLRQENSRLEETVGSLISRRDHLLAVNARLSVPLNTGTGSVAPQASSSPSSTPALPPPSTSASTPPSPSLTSHVPPPQQRPMPSMASQAQGHLTMASAHRGPSPLVVGHDPRRVSPQERRISLPQVPMENGLGGEGGEFRYRSPGIEHRQHSPMLPPTSQQSPNTLRQSPAANVSYHGPVSSSSHAGPQTQSVSHGGVGTHLPPGHAYSHAPINRTDIHPHPAPNRAHHPPPPPPHGPPHGYPPMYHQMIPPPHHGNIVGQPPSVLRRDMVDGSRHVAMERR